MSDTPILQHWTEIAESPQQAEPLVEGVIDQGSFVLAFGASNVGKSLAALDLAICVSLGRDWCGRKVRQGAVAIFALEGGAGISRRIAAWQQHHKVDITEAPIFVSTETLDLLNERDCMRIIAEMQSLAKNDDAVKLVEIDTVSRALAGSDENSAEDMGFFVHQIDRIRTETGAAILCIHHPGKDAERGARGHSSLRAAVDTEIELKRAADDQIECTVTKQRDYPTGGSFAFNVETVTPEDGKRPSAVAVYSGDVVRKPAAKRLNGQARIAMDGLRKAIDAGGVVPPTSAHVPPNVRAIEMNHWELYCDKLLTADTDKPESRKKAFRRAVTKLQEAGLIGKWDPWVWIT